VAIAVTTIIALFLDRNNLSSNFGTLYAGPAFAPQDTANIDRYTRFYSDIYTQDTQWVANHCVTAWLDSTCLPQNNRPTVFLGGDSHGHFLIAPLAELAKAGDVNLFLFSKALSLPPGLVASTVLEEGDWRSVLSWLPKNAKAGDIFLLGERVNPKVSNQVPISEQTIGRYRSGKAQVFYDGRSLDRTETLARYRTALIGLARDLAAGGMTLVLLAPLPELRWVAAQCALKLSTLFDSCRPVSLQEETAYRASALSVMADVAAHEENVILWDVMNIVCPPIGCSGVIDGRVVFMDDNHLSFETVRTLAPDLHRLLKSRHLIGK
jgi:hypothetical protein